MALVAAAVNVNLTAFNSCTNIHYNNKNIYDDIHKENAGTCYKLNFCAFAALCPFTFSRQWMTSLVHHLHSIKPALHSNVKCIVSIFGLHYTAEFYIYDVCRRPPVLLSGHGSSICASLWCMLMCWSRVSQHRMLNSQSEVLISVCFCYLCSQIWTSRSLNLLLHFSGNIFSDGKSTLKVTTKDLETLTTVYF